jgi:alkylation response protein AidB-like acyl-CoA dehydrogenase
VDFRDSPDEARFRAEVRAWLRDNVPDGSATPRPGRGDVDAGRAWSRKLHEAGYAGLTWPAEYGGTGAPYTHQAIFLEESARAGAPGHVGVIGLAMAGPTIMAHGSDAQKARHLARILSGEEIFCQGFSEPACGSDLSAIRTMAVPDGDHLVVDGEKIWCGWAEVADWCILLARGEAGARRYAGLTFLIVDMHDPGITVEPLRQLTGHAEFNRVRFDGVRVPRANVVGEPGDGWTVAMTTLLHERGTLGFGLTAYLEQTLGHLVRLARTPDAGGARPADDPIVRDRIARLWIDLQGLRYTNYRSLTALVRTGIPGPEGSIAKLWWSEANQRLTRLAAELLGPDAQLDGDDAPWGGFWQYMRLRSRANTIEGGTSEVLRNIIAERVVGLPRSR